MIQLAALFALISYVVAAPPALNLVNLADLNSIFPVFNGSEIFHNVTQLTNLVSGFPPGPQPPDPPGYFFYDVPRSNPKMTIKFRDWVLNPQRSESDTYDIFRAAFRAASDPTLRDTAMEEKTHVWTFGDVELEMNPAKADEEPFPLTWGLWYIALTGVDNFRRFYPRLNTVFEVFIYPPGYEEDDNHLGIGYLDS